MDLKKLDGRKAALLAPLHEIPSISKLYSSPIREIDPRKTITTEQNTNTNEILVCLNSFKYQKCI